MIDYSLILVTNYVGSKWSLNGISYDGFTWLDSTPKPTQSELDAQWVDVQAATLQSQANATAQAYLASTDWMVLRQADSGEAMPSSIKDARAAARLEIK